ncbi:MAG: CinA family nicotinamide mononucleotide deamidase-related protein [Desulfuromonadaceae bacterium]|nr:CinA family nicotinamide mononucleotide deamidase-related protein [Desulfuromonadaceae bacterium]
MEIVLMIIGDELLNGEIHDTNSRCIATTLQEEGYRLSEIITVADEPARISSALRRYNQAGCAVIASGGLGPTRDDVTARAAAQAFHLNLCLNDLALKQIQNFFRNRGQSCPPGNEKQALLPHKAQIMENSCGSAPGFILSHNNCPVFFLPGVPHEMEAMLRHQVMPILQQTLPHHFSCRRKVWRTFGVAEAEIEQRLSRLKLPDGLNLAYRLDFPQVVIKLDCPTTDWERLEQGGKLIEQELARFIVARGHEGLPEVTARSLILSEQTLALAESCTGGLIAKLLTDQAGSSAFLVGSAVTYANSAKQYWLGVPELLLQQHGAVSAECAQAMANGVRQRAHTDLALAVTGIAGPGGGTDDKPVGTVYIALATAQHTEVRQHHFSGTREQIRLKTAFTALDWLRRSVGAPLPGT